MFLSLLQFFATKFLVLALHLESGSFPRPLSAQEEAEAFIHGCRGDHLLFLALSLSCFQGDCQSFM